MGHCRERGTGTHRTLPISKPLETFQRVCFQRYKLQKLGLNFPWLLRQPTAGPCFADSGCAPKFLSLFHILPGNSSPLHWAPRRSLGTGQCCDHRYLQLITLRPPCQQPPLTHTNTTATTSRLIRSCTQFPAGAGGRGITFSSTLISSGTSEADGHHTLLWPLLHMGSNGEEPFPRLHPAPVQEAQESCGGAGVLGHRTPPRRCRVCRRQPAAPSKARRAGERFPQVWRNKGALKSL